MAEEQLKVRGLIEIILKGGPEADEAKKKLDEMARSAAQAGAAGKTAGDQSTAGLKQTGTEAAVTKDKIDSVADSTKAYATAAEEAASAVSVSMDSGATKDNAKQVEDALLSLAGTMERLGITASSALPDVVASLDEIEGAGGPIKSETIPVFEQFLEVTGNVPDALAATQTAIEASRQMMTSLSDTVAGVAALFAGDATTAAHAFGIALTKTNGEMKEESELLAELSAKTDEYARAAQRAAEARREADRQRKEEARQTPAGGGGGAAPGAAGLTFGSVASTVGGLLGIASAAVVLHKAFGWVKSQIFEFAELQRSVGSLRFEMESLGIASSTELPRIRAFLREIQLGGGPIEAETLPAFTKLLGMTKDVDKALAALSLASDASERGMGSVGAAANGLAQILNGNASRAARQFGISLKDVTGRIKTDGEIFDEFVRKVRGAGDAFDDTKNALDKSKGAFAAFGSSIAEALSPAFDWIAGSFIPRLLTAIQNVTVTFANGLVFLFSIAVTAGRLIATALDPSTWFEGWDAGMEEVKRVFEEGLSDLDSINERHQARLAEIAGKGGKERADKEAAIAALRAQVDAEAARKRIEETRKTEIALTEIALRTAEDGSKQQLALQLRSLKLREAQAIAEAESNEGSVSEIQKRYQAEREATITEHARRVRDILFSAQQELLQAQIGATPEGTDERFALEAELLRRQADKAITEARKSGIAVQETEERFRTERDELERQHGEARLQRARDEQSRITQLELSMTEAGSARQFELEMRLIDLRYEGEMAAVRENEEAIQQLKIAKALETDAKLAQHIDAAYKRQITQDELLGDAQADVKRAAIEEQVAAVRHGTKRAFDLQEELIRFEAAEQEKAVERKYKEEDRKADAQVEADKRGIDAEEKSLNAQAALKTDAAIDDVERYKIVEIARLRSIGASDDEILEVINRAQKDKEDLYNEQQDSESKRHDEATKRKKDIDTDAAADSVKREKRKALELQAIQSRLNAAMIAIERARKEASVGSYVEAASSIAGALSAVFSKNKSVAVAAAIIDTIGSSVKAFNNAGGWPWGVLPAAVSLAFGYARVKQMRSTEAGSQGGGGESAGGGGGGVTVPPPAPRPSTQGGISTQIPSGGGFAGGGIVPGPDLKRDTVVAMTPEGRKFGLRGQERIYTPEMGMAVESAFRAKGGGPVTGSDGKGWTPEFRRFVMQRGETMSGFALGGIVPGAPALSGNRLVAALAPPQIEPIGPSPIPPRVTIDGVSGAARAALTPSQAKETLTIQVPVTIHGMYGGRAGKRQLVRELEPIIVAELSKKLR